MRLSALDLVTKILSDRLEYKSWKDGLYKGKASEFFFDAMEKDKRGAKVMKGKVNGKSLDMTIAAIKKEMNSVKKLMKMSMTEVTPEFLYAFDLERDVTQPFSTASPVLQQVLLAASRSPRAIHSNARDTAAVSLFS
jgi:hypothetical protein